MDPRQRARPFEICPLVREQEGPTRMSKRPRRPLLFPHQNEWFQGPPPRRFPMTPVADLLLATARSRLTSADIARMRRALHEITDWTALIEAALAHGTAGLLCFHL